jgi:RNA polymerase sigma factor (sigma-70 family)
LNRHKNRVFTYIQLVVRNRDLAEDIFQESFMKAIVTIKQGRYVDNGKFYSWVTRIAHNLIIDLYRRERNENTVSNEEFAEVDLFNNAKLCDENVEDVLVREQVFTDVRKLMHHLPDNQKEVVQLRYYEDRSFKEIADLTGVSINTALGRMRYAVLNMRRMAEEKDISLAY